MEGGSGMLLASGSLAARVNPAAGMNVESLVFQGSPVIKVDEERQKNGQTYSLPILYPNPNRVREDRLYIAPDRTVPGGSHGFGKLLAFETKGPQATQKGAWVLGRVVFNQEHALFPRFPFVHQLEVRIAVEGSTLTHEYRVVNLGSEPLPYGFGLHPFFYDPNHEGKLKMDAAEVVVRDAASYPTGEMRKVEGDFDYRQMRRLRGAKLNDCFAGKRAWIEMPDYRLCITGEGPYQYLMVFTPAEPAFCVESQTCVPDAHFLHFQENRNMAGLQMVMPGEEAGGKVVYSFERRGE